MAEPIVFTLGIAGPFFTAKCANVRKGDFHLLREAPESARAAPGSETMVECPEIMLVLSGAFEMVIPGLGVVDLQAGDMGWSERFKGAIRIVAEEDGSSYACMRPRRGQFWKRMAGFVPAGETMTVEIPESFEEALLYVASGALETDAAGTGEVGTLRPLPTGESAVTAVQSTRFIVVWR